MAWSLWPESPACRTVRGGSVSSCTIGGFQPTLHAGHDRRRLGRGGAADGVICMAHIFNAP